MLDWSSDHFGNYIRRLIKKTNQQINQHKDKSLVATLVSCSCLIGLPILLLCHFTITASSLATDSLLVDNIHTDRINLIELLQNCNWNYTSLSFWKHSYISEQCPHGKLCWTNLHCASETFCEKKHLGVGNTPNQTAMMAMACCTHSSTHANTPPRSPSTHTDRARRSKTQLSQYTPTQAGSSLESRRVGLWPKGLTMQIPTLLLPKQPSKYLEQGTFRAGQSHLFW